MIGHSGIDLDVEFDIRAACCTARRTHILTYLCLIICYCNLHPIIISTSITLIGSAMLGRVSDGPLGGRVKVGNVALGFDCDNVFQHPQKALTACVSYYVMKKKLKIIYHLFQFPNLLCLELSKTFKTYFCPY